ncbi:MAG: short-chain dehydrogenase/reductase [Propionibacteriaceae bacterium]|jgi:short-subunit dehydrogenase|nr:short-chain dehydrogenase/reductase [Propionibacteriaceae bacterium]
MTETKPLALVTGASSGIGLELARQFAAHDFDLLICAEDDRIETAAGELRALGTDVRLVQTDLRTGEGVAELYAAAVATGRPLDAVALNAGVGHGGAFVSSDLEEELDLIRLNVMSTVHLAKLVLRDMTARDSGRLLITSSIASTMPGSFHAVYNASKSFLQSFAEALQNELKDTGVTVTSLMPGPTETNFFHRAQMDDTRVGQASKDDPRQVARQGFEALMDGRPKVVGGSVLTKAQVAAAAILPDAAKAQLHRLMAKPKGNHD